MKIDKCFNFDSTPHETGKEKYLRAVPCIDESGNIRYNLEEFEMEVVEIEEKSRKKLMSLITEEINYADKVKMEIYKRPNAN